MRRHIVERITIKQQSSGAQSQDIAVSLQIGPVSVKMREHQTKEHL